MLTGRYLVLIEDDALMGNSLVQRLELEGAEVTWVRQAVRGVCGSSDTSQAGRCRDLRYSPA